MIQSGYLPGSTFLHNFDPRLKLFLLLCFALSFFLPLSPFVYAAYLVFLLLLTLSSIGAREMWIPIRTILPLLILVALLTPPFHRSGDQLARIWGPMVITTGGLMETVRLLFRFTGITVSFFLFFRTTDIETLILTLRWYRVPFSFALVITVAFRYIPYIASLYRSITDAHTLRHPSVSRKRRIRSRFHRLFPILVSVMIHSVKSIPSLAMALETRGFGRHERRSSLHSLPALQSKKKDAVFSVLLLVLLLSPLGI